MPLKRSILPALVLGLFFTSAHAGRPSKPQSAPKPTMTSEDIERANIDSEQFLADVGQRLAAQGPSGFNDLSQFLDRNRERISNILRVFRPNEYLANPAAQEYEQRYPDRTEGIPHQIVHLYKILDGIRDKLTKETFAPPEGFATAQNWFSDFYFLVKAELVIGRTFFELMERLEAEVNRQDAVDFFRTFRFQTLNDDLRLKPTAGDFEAFVRTNKSLFENRVLPILLRLAFDKDDKKTDQQIRNAARNTMLDLKDMIPAAALAERINLLMGNRESARQGFGTPANEAQHLMAGLSLEAGDADFRSAAERLLTIAGSGVNTIYDFLAGSFCTSCSDRYLDYLMANRSPHSQEIRQIAETMLKSLSTGSNPLLVTPAPTLTKVRFLLFSGRIEVDNIIDLAVSSSDPKYRSGLGTILDQNLKYLHPEDAGRHIARLFHKLTERNPKLELCAAALAGIPPSQ